MIKVRDGTLADIDARLAIDDSFANDRVLIIEARGEAPETTITMTWHQTKAPGSRRGIGHERERYAAELAKVDHAWVAEVDGVPAGFLNLERWDWQPAVGFIQDIAVDVPHRGQGVASALVSALQEYAPGAGYRGVYWEAQTDNSEAIRFALSRGFAFAGFNDSLYRNGDRERQRDADFEGLAYLMFWACA